MHQPPLSLCNPHANPPAVYFLRVSPYIYTHRVTSSVPPCDQIRHHVTILVTQPPIGNYRANLACHSCNSQPPMS